MKTSNRKWTEEIVRIGNQAVQEAQAKNRELGILNWYSVNGVIVNDAMEKTSTQTVATPVKK